MQHEAPFRCPSLLKAVCTRYYCKYGVLPQDAHIEAVRGTDRDPNMRAAYSDRRARIAAAEGWIQRRQVRSAIKVNLSLDVWQ